MSKKVERGHKSCLNSRVLIPRLKMNWNITRLTTLCLSISIGFFSICFATETISGEVVEDLFFYEGVKISGIEYPTDLNATTGTSSVTVDGMGSVTVGARGDGGMLRVIVWGGTKVSSERKWDESAKKTWWAGELTSPVRGRLVAAKDIEFTVAGNHMNSELVPLETYGLGLGNETFKFSPSATLVLPVNVPEFTKIWIAIKSGDTLQKIGEDDFCIVQNQLCVVDASSINEITLVREKFDRCVVTEISNGTIGNPPYCPLTCDRGFLFNDDMTRCVASGDDTAIQIYATDNVNIEGATVKRTGETGLLAGPARQGYIRYTGSNVQRTETNTENLMGNELREALRRNATVASRNANLEDAEANETAFAALKKQLNDVRGKIWTWENPVAINAEQGEVQVAGEEGVSGGGTGGALHASAPLLPSTGPAGIFVGIAALGFGLMAFSRRRRQ